MKLALDEYRKTLVLDPNNPEVHKNLGILYYYKIGDFLKAKVYWERYLALNPQDLQNPSIRQKVQDIQKDLEASHSHGSGRQTSDRRDQTKQVQSMKR